LTDDRVERLAEGSEAREADIETDVRHAPIGAAQQEQRSFDAPALQVPMRRFPECRVERTAEMRGGHAGNTGQCGYVERPAVHAVHGVTRTEEPPVGVFDRLAHARNSGSSGPRTLPRLV
jgi:hypothetical protein